MKNDYSGEIIVTQNLFLKLADPDFLKFTGLDMYASVSEVFGEGDADKIKQAPEQLKKGNYSAVLSLRRADGVYREVLAVFHSASESGEILTRINIAELSGLINEKNTLSTYIRIAETYFDILGGIMMKLESISKELEIFYVSDSCRRIIYRGSLNEWKDMLLEGKVEPEYLSQLQELFADMDSGKKSFVHTVKIRGFTGGTDSELCTFNCRTITGIGTGAENANIVLGCVETGNPEKLRNLFIDPVNDKDSFLDMLNKRAMIEHSKRILSLPTIKHSFFIIIDLDNFKSVNDVYGHIVGDEVLVRVAKIINENLARRGIVGRVGGDEILIVTDAIDEQTELRNMLRSIRTAVEWTFKDDPRALNVTCSIGACAYPENGRDFNSLFELADKMLYLAKSKGKNRYIVYTPELHDHLLKEAATPYSDKQTKKPSDDRVGIMHRLVDNYLIRHSYNNEKIFSEIGEGFNLSEILMVYEDFTNVFQWTPDGVSIDINTVPYFIPEGSFSELFNKDKLLILDGLYKLEGKFPEVEKSLTGKGIKSALFYRIDKMGKFSGYVMFGRRKQRQMWSEYEIMALSTAAKVFDVSMRE